MEDTHNIPPAYLKGFNQGYTLAKEIPEFTMKDIEKMPKSIQEKPRIKGIVDGMKQFNKEHYISKLKAKNPAPNKTITPNKGVNRN